MNRIATTLVVSGLATLPLGMGRAQALPRAAYCDARGQTPPPSLRVHSMLPALEQWSRTIDGLSPAARRDAFRRLVLAPEGNLFGSVFRRPEDEALDEYLEWVVPRLPAIFALGRQADLLLAPSAARMASLLPELTSRPVDVIVGVTLGRSNGTVRLRDGAPVLILGLDVQTIVSDRASVTEALIEHELAHVAHSRANPTVYAAVDRGLRGEASPIFLNLFSEGLAVWASACVSPGRTAEELMSSPTLAAAAQAAWPDAAPKLADALESSAPDVVADWFHMGVNPVGHPERFGYYAGARVAAIIACTTAPASLLRLTGREILRDVRAVLLRADSASGPASCDGRGGAVPR